MTELKPARESWNTFVERKIREAQERGEFDDLAGAGEPLPGMDEPYDDLWWVKRLIEREGLSILPGSLEVRREVAKGLEGLWRLPSETQVRRRVAALNAVIRTKNTSGVDEPVAGVGLIDEEEAVLRWRRRRSR